MLTRLIDVSLRHRWLVLAATGALVVAGLLAFRALPIDAFPDTTPTQVQVNTVATSFTPLETERQLTIPIEQVLAGLPRVAELRSISKFGLSQVTVRFEDGVDLWFARQLVAERLGRVEVPDGAERPVLGPLATGLGEVFHYLVRSDTRTLEEIRTLHDRVIAPELRSVPGVAEINAWGGNEKQWHVVVDPRRLQSFDLTLGDVYAALEQNNANVGGGVLERSGSSALVLGVAALDGPRAIEEVVIAARKGVPVRVRDVARVEVGREIRRGATTADGRGEAVLGLGFMLVGENSHAVTEALALRLKDVRTRLPAEVQVEPVYQRTELVDLVLRTVRTNLFEGALLVIAVLFAFLGDLRAGLVVAAAIPLSMLFAFSGMLRFGIAGTLMSLGAIDFGLIVDSSVILVENAARRLSESRGRSTLEVVRDAAVEVRKPTLFGELIIAVVYLPVLTLEGVEGKLFRPMALTVIFALAGSAILSMTLIPVLASFALRRRAGSAHGAPRWVEFLERRYTPVLDWALRHGRLVLAAATALVVGSAIGATRLGSEFVPRLSEGTIVINTVRLAEVSLEESIRYGTRIEQVILAKFPSEVRRVWTRTGTAEVATDPMGIELSDVFVTLTPRAKWRRAESQDELVAEMKAELADLPGMRMAFLQPIEMRVNEMIAGVRSDLGIKLFGEDLDVLRALARQVEAVVGAVPGAADVTVEQISGQPVLEITVDRIAIARHGIPAREVLDVIAALGTRAAGEVREGERRVDLAVRLSDEYRDDPVKLASVPVRAPGGERVPIGQLVTIREVSGPTTIQREWGERRLVVQANVRGRDLGGFVSEVRERLASEVEMPSGYHIRFGGQFENLVRARARLMVVVPIALALILGLLYVTYGRVLDALRIFVGVPFAMVGGVAALLLRGLPFSISAAVGFVALSGVSVLGDMVLVSRVGQLLDAGRPLDEAVREAARTRLRPVLMTATVAAIGFLPMALNTGVGAEVQRPLATVVIGGVISSTLLTLLVLPVLYRIFGSRSRTAASTSQGRALPVSAAVVLFAVLGLAPTPGWAAEPITVDAAVQRALGNSPALRELEAAVSEAEGRVGIADRIVRTNPEASLTLGTRRGSTEEDVEYGISLAQPVEVAGQRTARIASTRASLAAARARLAERRADVVAQARIAHVRLLAGDEHRRLAEEGRALAARALTAAEQRHRAGDASLIELNTARVELGRATRAVITAEEECTSAAIELAVLVGAPSGADLQAAGQLATSPAAAPEASVVVAEGLARRAAVVAARRELEAARAEASLAVRDAIPTPRVGVAYDREEGADIVRGLLAVDLPVFDRNDQERHATEAQVRAAQARLEAVEREATVEIATAASRLASAEGAVAAFGDEVLTALDRNATLVQEGYEAGRIDFLDVVLMRRELLGARHEHVESLEQLHRARAELDRAIGLIRETEAVNRGFEPALQENE